jgi:hypothetical protein
VSTDRQEAENQVRQLREVVARRRLEMVEVYLVEAPAWKGRHRADLDKVLRDAKDGRFDVLLVWALDRLTREGPPETLQVVDRLGRAGVQVVRRCASCSSRSPGGSPASRAPGSRSARRPGLSEPTPRGRAWDGRPRTPAQLHRRWAEVRDLVLDGTPIPAVGARRLRVRYQTFVEALPPSESGGPVAELSEAV